jgi:hypothetical protein
VTRCTFSLILLLLAAPAAAGPITTNLTGDCVDALPTEGASWQSTSHFRFAVFWDDVLDCAPTIAHGYGPYERFDDFDGTGGLRIEMSADALYACKKHQIDWQEVLEDGSLGLLGAIIINPGLNGSCQGGTSELSLQPSGTEEPPPASVPEPGTLLMALIGACALVIRRHVATARRHPHAV